MSHRRRPVDQADAHRLYATLVALELAAGGDPRELWHVGRPSPFGDDQALGPYVFKRRIWPR